MNYKIAAIWQKRVKSIYNKLKINHPWIIKVLMSYQNRSRQNKKIISYSQLMYKKTKRRAKRYKGSSKGRIRSKIDKHSFC